MSPLREAVSSVSDLSQNPPSNSSFRAGNQIVLRDLARFGPGSSPSDMSLVGAQEYCRNLAKSHYENFSIASFLIPGLLRQDFYNVYAYCRWSDDLADEMGTTAESCSLLVWWQEELEACFVGKRVHPVFIALGDTIDRHHFDSTPFSALLSAFKQDQRKNRYETDDEIIDYCKGSAHPVGRILLKLARVESPQAISLSDSVCTGLQLANFCQDMRRDALKDRIYLPRSRWTRHHLDETMIKQAKRTPQLQAALEDWCRDASRHLTSGLALVKEVPLWLARDVQLFVRGGLSILRNIAKQEYDCWSKPIEVTKPQKFLLLLRACVAPRSTRVAPLPTERSMGTQR